MAHASDSNDASDIFWPGYVDAVTNLAINLLFVIAVMSIVVLSAIMQISKMKPEDTDQTSMLHRTQVAKPAPEAVTETSSLEKLQAEKIETEKKLQAQTQALAQAQKELQQLKQTSARSKATAAPSTDLPTNADAQDPADEVKAQDKQLKPSTGNTQFSPVKQGGLVVAFDKDVVDLSDKETTELLKKLATIGPINSTAWQIWVYVPKGFSEAARLGYYRVNAVRNALIHNGAPAGSITMRVLETDHAGANNTRVVVKAGQP